MRAYLEKSSGPGHSSVINVNVWNKIVRGSPKPKGGARLVDPLTKEHDLIHTPISDHIFKHRSLQGKFDDVEKILEREGFLINDLSLILPKIIQDSTKSIAFARVFGKGGQLLKPLLELFGITLISRYQQSDITEVSFFFIFCFTGKFFSSSFQRKSALLGC